MFLQQSSSAALEPTCVRRIDLGEVVGRGRAVEGDLQGKERFKVGRLDVFTAAFNRPPEMPQRDATRPWISAQRGWRAGRHPLHGLGDLAQPVLIRFSATSRPYWVFQQRTRDGQID